MPDHNPTLEHYLAKVENGIDLWLPPATARPSSLHTAMRYSLEAGGKRLRPVLLLAMHDLFPSRGDPIPAAVAIECLHTYSLVHDDLPCMDDSDLRRGRPSCHRKFGETIAVLAGDALLTQAFRILATAYREQPEVGLELVRQLSIAADSEHLIGGQVEDTINEGRTLPEEDLEYIHLNKTAALLTCALSMGATLTLAPSSVRQEAELVGRNLGLAFQIVDDILDATATAETLGKTAGADAARSKNTWVSRHGLEVSRQTVSQLTEQAVQACLGWAPQGGFLVDLLRSMEHRVN